MRTSQLLFAASLVAGAAVAAFAACSSTPAVTVVHGPPQEQVKGDTIRLRHGAQEPYVGIPGGFFVVRTRDDWRYVWQDKPGGAPPLPPTLDLERQMLLLGISDDKGAVGMKIERAVDTGEVVHVWVKEIKTGEGCRTKHERAAFDAAVAPRLDKPVRFYVQEERGDSCGQPPTAGVECRIGDAKAWSARLTAQPGDKIECELTSDARGRYPIVDRVLSLGELPGGTSAKLAYAKGPTRGSFSVDVFGAYTVRAEVTDEIGRKGVGTAKIEAVPPKTKDVLVQLVWTNFDVSDDPEAFPRAKLRAFDPATQRACSAETPDPSLCQATAHGAYTVMTLKAAARKLPLSVEYVDERVEKGPLVCVQLYREGARTDETCDRAHRNPDERWNTGLVDLATGKFVAASAADAGADAAADAEAADAAPEAAAKPAKPAAKDAGAKKK